VLYFARRPDPVFTAILHDAVEDLHRILTEPDTDPEQPEQIWKADYPSAAKCFPLTLAVYTIDRLLAASKDPITIYRVTDYHWLLLYDCLDTYCEVHNDFAEGAAEKVFPVGPYEIGEIDFDAIVDHYFWDTDFLLDASTGAELGPEGRQIMGLSPEAFGISQELAPHSEELKFEALGQPEWESEALMEEPEGPRIPKYPPEAEDE
jgi:hypothetical protein